jgi:hypothetical protein
MKIILIIILILLLIYLNNNKKYENFGEDIQTDINNILNNTYNSDFSILSLLSSKILNIKQNNMVNLTDNLNVTGILNLNSPVSNNLKYLKIKNSVIFNKKDNNNYFMDIFPQYFIMIWGNISNIPKGWVLCDGKKYIIENGIPIESNQGNYIQTPDLRGTVLQNYTREEINKIIDASNKKQTITNINFNLRYGTEFFDMYPWMIPAHKHRLATKKSNPVQGANFGFDFEQSILESEETYFDTSMDPYYRDSSAEAKNGFRCGFCAGLCSACDNLVVWRKHGPETMNRRKIDQWKEATGNDPLYYGASSIYSDTFNPDGVGTKDLNDILLNNGKISPKKIDIRPPTFALHYIMKLT